MKGRQVVLTSDSTIMSSYHNGAILGLAGILPRSVMPKWFFSKLFCPEIESFGDGRAKLAPAGLRRIEAALLENGFDRSDVIVAPPNKLQRVIGQDTRIVGITHDDPLGKIACHEIEQLMGKGTSYNRSLFLRLLNHPLIKKYRPKIVVGGKGAWEVTGEMEEIGIDHVLVGEGDVEAPLLFKKLLSGEKPPKIVKCGNVPVEAISDAKGASICGIVEIARGCPRGCAFCLPAMQGFQSRLVESVIRDIKTNLDSGMKNVLLCSEDALMYGAGGLKVNEGAVVELFRRIKALEGAGIVDIIHTSLSTVHHHPRLVKQVSEIAGIGRDQRSMAVWLGIETGSSRLIERYMPGKAKPSKPEEWPEMVRDAYRILADNGWISISSLILGLPGEETGDVIKTIDLIEDLKDYCTIILPLFFSSIEQSRLRNANSFRGKNMLPEHWALIGLCLEHNLKHAEEVFEIYSERLNLSLPMRLAWKAMLKLAKHKLKEYVKPMKNGEAPFSAINLPGNYESGSGLYY